MGLHDFTSTVCTAKAELSQSQAGWSRHALVMGCSHTTFFGKLCKTQSPRDVLPDISPNCRAHTTRRSPTFLRSNRADKAPLNDS